MGRRRCARARGMSQSHARTSTWLPPRSSVTTQTSSPCVSSGSASSTRFRTCLRRRLIEAVRSKGVPSDVTQSGDRGKQTESPAEAESHSLPRPSISRTPRPTSTMGAFTTHVPSYTPFAFDASRLLGRRIQPHAPRLRLRPPGSPRRRLKTRISNSTPPSSQTSTRRLPTPKRRCTCP